MDLRRAFDSCNHRKMMNIFNEKFGTENTPLCKYMSTMYNNIFITIKNKNNFSAPHKQHVGIKQGCTLSPLMFNIYFNQVLEEISPRGGDGDHITPCFADDLALGTTSHSKMEQLLEKMLNIFRELQLDMNLVKTELMIVNKYNKIISYIY